MSRSSKHTYRTTIEMFIGGYDLANVELEISFSFTPATPESGRFGPVENYDPGSGHVVEDVVVTPADPKQELPAWIVDMIEASEEIRAEMIENALDQIGEDA